MPATMAKLHDGDRRFVEDVTVSREYGSVPSLVCWGSRHFMLFSDGEIPVYAEVPCLRVFTEREMEAMR
jgi:hypothetical protein